MKFCIGCKHLFYQPEEPGFMGSSWTGWTPGEPAEFACRQGHWLEKLNGDFTQEKFQSAMESAQTCPDYFEREMPE